MPSPNNTNLATADKSTITPPLRGTSWASQLLGVQGPLIGLVVLCVIFSLSTNNAFLSVRNALNVLNQITVLGILSLGMTAVIVIGGASLHAIIQLG